MTRSKALKMAALTGLAVLAGTGIADAAGKPVSAQLSGYEEVPALSTAARGTFQGALRPASISYKLTYKNLGSAITQAHIHFAQKGVNGGISLFLCTNLGNGPVGTPTCPGTTAGTVTGSVTAAGIVGPSAQGIAAGELAEVVHAILAGAAYVNVHTTGIPGGEARGQIVVGE